MEFVLLEVQSNVARDLQEEYWSRVVFGGHDRQMVFEGLGRGGLKVGQWPSTASRVI
jgi:hypothetical protein